jgi:hypothetical protein
MFSGLFLLVAGVVMVVSTTLGLRRGRIMTMGKSAAQNTAKWAARGEADFLPYILVWYSAGLFLAYQGLRLMFWA